MSEDWKELDELQIEVRDMINDTISTPLEITDLNLAAARATDMVREKLLAKQGWLPIKTMDQKTAPYGALIKAPSLVCPDFNPEGISIGCRVHDANDAPIATVKWNGSHDFYGDREITDATHWKPFDFRVTDPESLEILDAMIRDRDYFSDENERLKAQSSKIPLDAADRVQAILWNVLWIADDERSDEGDREGIQTATDQVFALLRPPVEASNG
ncbi:MAG: hypothetical protein AAFP81_17290 [Pseudomonadota bacterium]